MAGKKEEKELKVNDVVPGFSEKLRNEIISTIKVLDELSTRYLNMEDPFELYNLKKHFNAHLQRFATLFSQVKIFKGSQHVYLEEERKRLKAETFEILKTKGVNKTEAEKLVYAEAYYIERLDMIRNVAKLLIKTELLYDRYDQTLQCIIQSISLHKSVMEKDMKAG